MNIDWAKKKQKMVETLYFSLINLAYLPSHSVEIVPRVEPSQKSAHGASIDPRMEASILAPPTVATRGFT